MPTNLACTASIDIDDDNVVVDNVDDEVVDNVVDESSSSSSDEECACTIEQLVAYIVFSAGLCAACALIVAAMLYIYKH